MTMEIRSMTMDRIIKMQDKKDFRSNWKLRSKIVIKENPKQRDNTSNVLIHS